MSSWIDIGPLEAIPMRGARKVQTEMGCVAVFRTAGDEVFALVDEYAEASQRGEDVASLKPLIRHHLDMCRECDEEYQALLSVLEGTKAS